MTLKWFFNHREPAWLMDAIQPLHDSVWIIVIAGVLRFLPVGVVVVLPSVERVPPAMYESARSDGAGWLARILRIYWPQCWKGAVLAGLVVLILTLGELDCVHIISPPGIETLSKRLFSFIHAGVDAQVATVCAASMVTACVPAIALFCLGRRRIF